jgi:RNA polymerase-binding transcription factor DksA
MATGWAADRAVTDQIDDTIKDAVSRAILHAQTAGPAPINCTECGEPIPERCRAALPGVRTCVPCQSERDTSAAHSPYNRRGYNDRHPH